MTTTYKPLEITENRNGDITQIEYHNATPDYLFDLSMDTTERHLERSLGAAGLVRLCLDIAPARRDETHLDATVWASRHLLNVRDGFGVSRIEEMPSFFREIKPNTVTGTVDDLTVTGTAVNRPAKFVEIIDSVVPEVKDALVIAIGHGGILAAADTHIAGVGGPYYPVRHSLRKRGDKKPALSDMETRHLLELGKDRTVILLDEDCSHMMTTLCTGTEFFADMFGKTVYGASPAHVRNLGSFSPVVISSDKQMLIGPSYPGYWGGDVIG